MRCPNDNETLQMTAREGIEIDYCPSCRGVWLDRGELDKLIERSGNPGVQPLSSAAASHATPPPQQVHYHQSSQYDNERRHYDQYQPHHGKHKKKTLFDMFDF